MRDRIADVGAIDVRADLDTKRPNRLRLGGFAVAVVLVLAALVLTVVVQSNGDDGESTDEGRDSLPADTGGESAGAEPDVTAPQGTAVPGTDAPRWAPPDGWRGFEPVEVGPDGGRLRLDDGVDYRIVADRSVTAPVEIIGGRDVVWIGGEIVIDRADKASEPIDRAIGLTIRDHSGAETAAEPRPGDDDEPRLVHLEGLRLEGSALNEGIDVDAPTAVVQITNVHVGDITFAGADDRDGTGPYEDMGRNHPDIVQTYGGFTELRIDGLSGRSGYQGLFFKVDHEDGLNGTIRLRRVDISAIAFTGLDGYEYAGNRMYFWDAQTAGDQFLDTGTVWIEHHPDGGKVAAQPNPREGAGAWWQGAYRDGDRLVGEAAPGTALPTDAVERLSSGEPVIAPRSGIDRFGRYLWWPDPDDDDAPAVLDRTGERPGRIHVGRPPGGPYVPRDSVGLDYTSPWSGPQEVES